MGLCAYSGGLEGFRKLVTVNIWAIDAFELHRLAHKIKQRQSLNRQDLATLRHQGTNYDELLNAIMVTPERREFFQSVANETAEQALRNLVLAKDKNNLLSQYLKVTREYQRIARQLQKTRDLLKIRGKVVYRLNTQLQDREQELTKCQEDLLHLEHNFSMMREQMEESQQKLLFQIKKNQQLQEALHQHQLTLTKRQKFQFTQRQFWFGLCATALCSLTAGVFASRLALPDARIQFTSEVTQVKQY